MSHPQTFPSDSGASPDDRPTPSDLLPLVYEDLRRLAAAKLAGERCDHTLQPTALVHEAYMRLNEQTRAHWHSRTHFMAVAAEMIRRILVDHARAKAATKRGGGAGRVDAEHLQSLPAGDPSSRSAGQPDFELIDAALIELARRDARQSRVVVLRFYGGLEVSEIASVLGVSERTVGSDWRVARAWLARRLGGPLAD